MMLESSNDQFLQVVEKDALRWIVDVRRDWVWWEVGGEENFKKR
jgi:hypothetical protein